MIAQATFLFIGTTEIIFILFVAIMVFGADKLPEIARGMGKGMRQLRDATNDIKGEITKSVDQNVTKDIQKEIDQVKDEVEELSGSIKRKP